MIQLFNNFFVINKSTEKMFLSELESERNLSETELAVLRIPLKWKL